MTVSVVYEMKIQELMGGTKFRSLWSGHFQNTGAYGQIWEFMDEIQDLMEKNTHRVGNPN